MSFGKIADRSAEMAGSAPAFLLAVVGVLMWACSGPYFRYNDTWNFIINTSTTIITFLLGLLILHVQKRDNVALHAKLNAMILAMDGVSNDLSGIEKLPVKEIEEKIKCSE